MTLPQTWSQKSPVLFHCSGVFLNLSSQSPPTSSFPHSKCKLIDSQCCDRCVWVCVCVCLTACWRAVSKANRFKNTWRCGGTKGGRFSDWSHLWTFSAVPDRRGRWTDSSLSVLFEWRRPSAAAGDPLPHSFLSFPRVNMSKGVTAAAEGAVPQCLSTAVTQRYTAASKRPESISSS